MKIEMLNGNVLIAKLNQGEKTKSGVITGEVKRELVKGEIKGIGWSENGLKTGDVIYFRSNGLETMEIGDLGEVYVVRESNIEAIGE